MPEGSCPGAVGGAGCGTGAKPEGLSPKTNVVAGNGDIAGDDDIASDDDIAGDELAAKSGDVLPPAR